MTRTRPLVSAIGLLVDGDSGTMLVARITHLDGVDDAECVRAKERELRLVGSVPAVPPGALVAILGECDGSQLAVSEVRTANVADVFDQRPHLEPMADPSFARPVTTADHEQWEVSMIKEGRIVSSRRLRASDGSWRVVVSATEPEDVRRALLDAYGNQLTLVRSEWSLEQFDAIRQHLADRLDDWRIAVLLDGTTAEGLPVLRVSLREVTDEIREWLGELPTGAVEVYPFLTHDVSRAHFFDESRPYVNSLPPRPGKSGDDRRGNQR